MFFFNRLLGRLYWFYQRNIFKILETEHSKFFNPIAAFAGIIVLYIDVILILTKIVNLKEPYTLMVINISFFTIICILFYRQKDRTKFIMENNSKKPFDTIDIGIIFYIIFCFFLMFYTAFSIIPN